MPPNTNKIVILQEYIQISNALMILIINMENKMPY